LIDNAANNDGSKPFIGEAFRWCCNYLPLANRPVN